MTRSDRRQLAKGLAFTSPWLLGFLAFTLIPCALSLYYSFCDYSILESPAWIGMDNYRELFRDVEFYRTLKNTGYFALLTLPASLMVSLGLALLLNAPIRGQAIYRTVIFLPSLVPAVATAMVWMWLFNAKLGLINTALRAIGLETEIQFALINRAIFWLNVAALGIDVNLNIAPFRPLAFPPTWLNDPRTAMLAIAMMSLWGVGNTVVIYLAGLQDIPRDLYEAAEIDGAGPIRRLFNVTLPMLSPVIFFNLVMAIIGTLQVFAIPFIMTGGGPLRSTYLYTQYLYEKAFVYQQMGYASAMAWIQLLIILALTGFAFWTSKRWVHYQGK